MGRGRGGRLDITGIRNPQIKPVCNPKWVRYIKWLDLSVPGIARNSPLCPARRCRAAPFLHPELTKMSRPKAVDPMMVRGQIPDFVKETTGPPLAYSASRVKGLRRRHGGGDRCIGRTTFCPGRRAE